MNRGMKKWAPFKALDEQAEYIAKMRRNKQKIERPHISEDKAEEINDVLVHYHHQILTIKYFDDGFVNTIHAPIEKIDVENKRIYLDRLSYIDFINIIDLYTYDY